MQNNQWKIVGDQLLTKGPIKLKDYPVRTRTDAWDLFFKRIERPRFTGMQGVTQGTWKTDVHYFNANMDRLLEPDVNI